MDLAADSDSGYDETDRVSGYSRLLDFGDSTEFAHHRMRCYERLWGAYADRLRDPGHELRRRLPMISANEINHRIVDAPLPGGRTIAQTFLERGRSNLTSGQRRFLTDLSRSCVSLYEIARVEPGRGFELFDLWRSNRCFVHERLASQQLDRWDLLGARLLTRPDGRTVIDSDLWPYHPSAKAKLIAGLEREQTALRRLRGDVAAEVFLKSSGHVFAQVFAQQHHEPEEPELATFDGEPVEPTRMLFEVDDPRALRRRLSGQPDFDSTGPHEFAWGKPKDGVTYGLGWVEFPTSGGRELVATAMSRVHAQQLRATLERLGRSALAWRSERTFTIGEWVQQGGRLSAATPSAPRRVDASVARALEERHYREWPDSPLPALDGRTPREAVLDEAQRPRVLELLKSLENSQQQRARYDGVPALDISSVWRALGIEPPAPPPTIVPARMPVIDLHEWVFRHAPGIVGGRQQARFERYKAIVRAAGDWQHPAELMTEIACARRPGRKKCVGRIQVLVADETRLRWRCGACGDAEELLGWKALLEAVDASERRAPAAERAARPVDPKDPWPELYRAVVEFRELAPWRWLVDEQVFGVEDPATGEVGWCCVLGAAGEIEGLAIYLGDRGFDRWRRVHAEGFRPDEALFGQDALVLTFEDRDSVSPNVRRRLRSLGIACRGERAWPSIESHHFGVLPRAVDWVEATRMAHTIDQVLTVAARAGDGEGLVGPDSNGRYLVRRLARSSDPRARWSDERIEPPHPIVRNLPDLDSVAVERLRQSIPHPRGVWEVDIVPVPAPIEEPGQEPYLPASFVALERESGRIVHVDLRAPSDFLLQAQEGFLEAVRFSKTRPITVCVRRAWLVDGLTRVAEALGIRLEVCEELDLLSGAVEQMNAALNERRGAATRKWSPGER